MLKRLGTLLAFGLAMMLPVASMASPWVLRENELVVTGRFDFQQANREYLGAGELQQFPLNGRLRAATYETNVRIGLVERLELGLRIPVRQVSYRADPVILVPCAEGAGRSECFQQSQENVLSLSRTVSGLADIRLSARYQFLRGRFAGALGLEFKTPTGYERPAGTFGREPKDREEFLENTGRFVRPENVQDDVTLGDGQADLGLITYWGWSLPTRTFLRLDSGYRLRTRGAGDQIVANFQIGQQLGERFLLKLGSNFAYSVEEGDIIGVSVAADDPSLPAEQYQGTTNLRLREVPLSWDRLQLQGGMLVRITPTAELNLSYARVVWGRNTSLTQTVSLGLGFQFDISGEEGG